MTSVLLLPGWGFRASVFMPLVEALGHDYRFDNIESTEYGAGPELPASIYRRAAHSDLLIGWSLGSLVALQLASEALVSDRAMVLLSATPSFVRRSDWPQGMAVDTFTGFSAQVESDANAGLKQFVRLNYGKRMNRHTREYLDTNTVTPDNDGLLEGLTRLANSDLREQVAEINTRTLVMQAANDRLVNPASGSWLCAQLPHAQCKQFDSGGHAFFIEHAAEVAETIKRWKQ